MKKKTKIALAIGVVAIIILSGYYLYKKPEKEFHLSYGSIRTSINPMIINIDDKSLIPAAVCFAPATNDGKGYFVPLFFSTGESLPSHINKKYDPTTIFISDFGKNPSEASISIAKKYWEKIELVIIVSTYEDTLKATPLAAFLNAPIVFKGDKVDNFLKDEKIENVIVIGYKKYDGVGVKNLKNEKEIWNYYLERLNEKGKTCNYVVLTNPEDIKKDVMLPYLSLSSAPLSCYRRAIVVTGDYTTEKKKIFQLGYGCGDAGSGERGKDPDTLPDDTEMKLQRSINEKAIEIDNDVDEAVEFLKDRNMEAEYLALVGAPDAVPMLYIKNPIWYEDANEGDNGEEYLATDSYYSDLDIKLSSAKNVIGEYICEGTAGNYNGSNYEYADSKLYTQELGVGRIVAWNLLDASALVVRSIMYSKPSYELVKDFHSILTSRVCGTASPGSAEEQANVFRAIRIPSTRLGWVPPSTLGFWEPEAISTSHSAGDPARMTKANFIIYDGHGFPDGWYYWWVHMHEQEESPDTIRTEDVRKLALKPSVAFSASCLCSALDWPVIWNGSADERRYDDLGMEMFFSLALIHAGALAHLGSTEESWGAFIGGKVEGYGDFDLATFYFEKLLQNDLTIGKAHSVAKEEFIGSQSADSLPFTQTCFLENVLYGEPGVNP